MQELKSAILAFFQNGLGWLCPVSVAHNNHSKEFKNSKLKIDREGHLQILKCKIKLRGIQSETFNQNLM